MHFKAFESVYHLDRAGHLCAIVLGGGGSACTHSASVSARHCLCAIVGSDRIALTVIKEISTVGKEVNVYSDDARMYAVASLAVVMTVVISADKCPYVSNLFMILVGALLCFCSADCYSSPEDP